MKLGIIGAMTVEIESLKAQMLNLEKTEKAGMEFCSGILEGVDAVLVVCGVGKVNAAMCVQILVDCFAVTHIINTGIAGSLCTELDIGDLVISKDAIYHDFTCQALNPAYIVGQVPGLPVRSFTADADMIACVLKAAEGVHAGHIRVGTVASGDQFVCQKELKEQIIASTGALCTEMEGAAIAHTAWRNNIPFVVIRAISDKADDSAQMDYPTFEAIAAERCAAVTRAVARQMTK